MAARTKILYRRSPYLVAYWKHGYLALHNYATGKIVSGSPAIVEILGFFDEWRPAGEALKYFPHYSERLLRATVDKLVKLTLLERSDQPRSPKLDTMEKWQRWHPAAGFFHFATKDTRYTADREAAARSYRAQLRREPIPATVKRYRESAQFSLPDAVTPADRDFSRTLLARRTWRDFARTPISIEQLATLLKLTAGVHGWLDIPLLGRAPLKTYPSGGARHPTETYVLALRVKGLPHGLYHYAADVHRLERLRPGASPRDIGRMLPGQPWYKAAAALVFFTAVFPRPQWKYHAARAYRAVLIEAGHACQNFLLTATWLGLAPFCSMALADTKTEKSLGIDGVSESVIYAAGVGVRPPGKQSGRWPDRLRPKN